jgi:hypothetical protein
MAISHIKSTPVTNLDAAPPTANTAGEGASALLRQIGGFVTAVAADSINTTYQLVRIPSNAKVKQVYLESEAQTAGAVSVGLYYATDGEGGKPTSLLAANAISAAFFGNAISVAAAVTPTDITNQSGTYTLDKRNQPIWQAAGLTTDPGGYFDVVATVTTAITTGTGRLGVDVRWAE